MIKLMFQYAEKDPQRVSNIKPFINKNNLDGIKYP